MFPTHVETSFKETCNKIYLYKYPTLLTSSFNQNSHDDAFVVLHDYRICEIYLFVQSLSPPPQNEHGSGKKITETSFFNGHLIVIFLMTFAILNQKTSENFYFIDREK